MANLQRIPEQQNPFPDFPIRTFNTGISKHATLEISYMDFGEDSQITSVVMVLDENTTRRIRHITKKVFRSPRLLALCNSQMKSYILLRGEQVESEDERWDAKTIEEEFFYSVNATA